MKTILHFANQNDLKLLNHHILGLAHLITYTVPCMNGDYEDRVVVYKNRAGNQGKEISHIQLKILQDCVLNDKPQPEFMKSSAQKAQDAIKRMQEKQKQERDDTINFYKHRLEKMEGDLFPSGYIDGPGPVTFPYDKIEDRFSRIEKMLGVVKSPGDISLARLENVEYHFYGITTRLGNLEIAIFPTQKDVDHMRPVITLEGRFKRLEEKLGVNLAFTDLDHRLKHIEYALKYAWNCMKSYREFERILNTTPINTKGIQPMLTIGKYVVYQDTSYTSDSSVLMGFKGKVTIGKPEINAPYVCPVLIKHQEALQNALQDAFRKKTYVPKYQVGDVLEFHNESCVYKVTRKIIGIGLLIKTDPNILYYNFDREDGHYIPCEQVDKDNCSIFKVAPVAWEG